MKLLLKLLLAPIRLAIWLTVRLFALVAYLSSFALGVVGAILGVLAVIVLLTVSVKNGFILLAAAYLISPFGFPMLAVKSLKSRSKRKSSCLLRWFFVLATLQIPDGTFQYHRGFGISSN